MKLVNNCHKVALASQVCLQEGVILAVAVGTWQKIDPWQVRVNTCTAVPVSKIICNAVGHHHHYDSNLSTASGENADAATHETPLLQNHLFKGVQHILAQGGWRDETFDWVDYRQLERILSWKLSIFLNDCFRSQSDLGCVPCCVVDTVDRRQAFATSAVRLIRSCSHHQRLDQRPTLAQARHRLICSGQPGAAQHAVRKFAQLSIRPCPRKLVEGQLRGQLLLRSEWLHTTGRIQTGAASDMLQVAQAG